MINFVKHLRYALILIVIPLSAYANLRFELDWYFSEQEVSSGLLGVMQEQAPFIEDRANDQAEYHEISLAELQSRVEHLVAWFDTQQTSHKSEVLKEASVVTTSPVTRLRKERAQQLDLKLDTAAVQLNQGSNLQETNKTLCEGLIFSHSVDALFVDLKTDEVLESEDLQNCLESLSPQEHFLWVSEASEHPAVRLTVQGQLKLTEPINLSGFQRVFEDGYNVVAMVQGWQASPEDVDVLVDNLSADVDDSEILVTPNGLQVKLYIEPDDQIHEVRLAAFGELEEKIFLVDLSSLMDQVTLFGQVEESAPIPDIWAQLPQDPSTLFTYYDEQQGKYVDIVSGTALLDNFVLPHLFEVDHLVDERVEGLALYAGGLLESYLLQDVQTQIDWVYQQLGYLQNQPDHVLVVSANSRDGPELRRIEGQADGSMNWGSVVPSHQFTLESGQTLFVFLDLDEGEYWLQSAAIGESVYQPLILFKDIDGFVTD